MNKIKLMSIEGNTGHFAVYDGTEVVSSFSASIKDSATLRQRLTEELSDMDTKKARVNDALTSVNPVEHV